MNTPAHLIIAAAAFAKPDKPGSVWAAILGALAPDASLYLLAGISLFILGIEPQIVFGQLYFSDIWQQVFAIDNSVFVWGGLAVLFWRLGWGNGLVFCLAALLHLALDFPLHHDDGRPHFWPISDWVFESPISYWDSAHYGTIVSIFEVLLVIVLTVILFKRFKPDQNAPIWVPNMRWLFVFLAGLQLAPAIIFGLMF